MANATVDDIQGRIAAVVDQDEDTSSISSDDYSLRLNYINRRERIWAEIGNWQCLYKEYHTLTSTNSGNTSISLPNDFRKLASFPEITYDGVQTSCFPEVRGQEESQYVPASEKYIKIMGDPRNGYTMKVNPGVSSGQLASGASIYVPYYSFPSSLASPANAVTCPNPEYLIQGVIADIWEAREDARFQGAKVEANLILQNMLEREFTPTEASAHDRIKTYEETRYSFRIGRD
jgi:hypothetical protein